LVIVFFFFFFILILQFNFWILLFLFIFNPFLSSLYFLLSLNLFFVKKYILHFEFDSAHFNNIIFFQKKVLIFMILASFNKSHNIVHSFSHLNRGQSRFPTFKITVIYILVNIKRLGTMNVKLVLHFSYCEHFLILIPILASYVLIWVHEQDLIGFSQDFLVS